MARVTRPAVGINPNIPVPVQRDLRKVADYAFDAASNADKALAALPDKLSRSQEDLLSISKFVSGQVQANGAYPLNLTGLQLTEASSTLAGAVKPDGTTIVIKNGVISVPTATTTSLGIVQPDGVSVDITGAGVISVPIATVILPGIVQPDGTTIKITVPGVISVPLATSSTPGIVQPDGTIITITAGAITVQKASASLFGVVKVDGTTITAAGGVISAPGGGGGGALAQIAQQILVAPAANITFSAISQSYINLRLIITARGTVAASTTGVGIQYNGDTTGADYNSVFGLNPGGGAQSNGQLTGSSFGSGFIGNIPGTTALANAPAQMEIIIPAYTAGFIKTSRSVGVVFHTATFANTQMDILDVHTAWNNTSNITDILLVPGSGNFAAGSIFTLYGMK